MEKPDATQGKNVTLKSGVVVTVHYSETGQNLEQCLSSVLCAHLSQKTIF